MNTEQELHELEISIEQANHEIDMFATLQKLYKNEDFKKLILDEYFVKESSRLVLLKADPNMGDPESQAGITRSIDAIGNLQQWFRLLSMKSEMAIRAKGEDQETREEILGEGE